MSSLRDGSARGVLMSSRLNQAKWMALPAFTARETNRPVGVRSSNDETAVSAFRTNEGVSPECADPKTEPPRKGSDPRTVISIKDSRNVLLALWVPAFWVLVLSSVSALLWLSRLLWGFLSAPGFGSGPCLLCFLCPFCELQLFVSTGLGEVAVFSDELWIGIPFGRRDDTDFPSLRLRGSRTCTSIMSST